MEILVKMTIPYWKIGPSLSRWQESNQVKPLQKIDQIQRTKQL